MRGQATPHTSKERTILWHPVKKALRAWWNLAPQKTSAKSCVHFTRHHPASFATLAKTHYSF